MRSFLKFMRNAIIAFVVIVIVIISSAFLNDQVDKKKEEVFWKNPPGQMVEVDGHKMHVYTEGEGEHTIVLLSGFSVSSPSPYLNFLPLCKELAKDNKVVIIERFGYGLSDVVDEERSFDTIVEQDRKALEKAGINGPYVLCPHSISGLETLIWAQNYPEEVEAIVGMDMSDTSVKGMKEMPMPLLQFFRVFRATGLYRMAFSPTDNSEESKMEYAIQCRTYSNKNLISEMQHIDAACDMISSKSIPTTPNLQFVAMRKHSVEEAEAWKSSHQEIVNASSNGKLIELDCEHYVYRFEKDRIAQEINAFLETL